MAGGRGGRGRGGRNPKDMPREQQVSRKVSWLLRHGAQQEGLKLGKGGYVGVADALNTRALKSLNITFKELQEVVASNDKQRFSMVLSRTLEDSSEADVVESEGLQSIPESDDPSDYLIRANQGHSINVDTKGLLTPITAEAGNIPPTVVHGTNDGAWKLILQSGGMRKMGRNHMHFASGLPAGFKSQDADADGSKVDDATSVPPVISGMRNSSTVLIYVDVAAALEAGITFFVSENGVILSDGDEQGSLPYQFFKRVESRKNGGGVLMRDGVLPEGAVVDVAEWERASMGSKKKGGRGGGRGGKARVNDDSADLLADV